MPSKRIRVIYTDGSSKEVRIGPKAEVMFERHFKMSMTKAGADISAESMYYLAWASLHCAGVEPHDFDSFLDVLEDVENVGDDEPVNPTQPVPSPES